MIGEASNFDLPATVSDFHPQPFLSLRSREAYEKPDRILKHPEEIGALPHVAGTLSREELWKLMKRWDEIGRLTLVPAEEVDKRLRRNQQ